MMDVNLIYVLIILQYIQILTHYTVYLTNEYDVSLSLLALKPLLLSTCGYIHIYARKFRLLLCLLQRTNRDLG